MTDQEDPQAGPRALTFGCGIWLLTVTLAVLSTFILASGCSAAHAAPDADAMADAALAEWGWRGMDITVEIGAMTQEHRAAEAYPDVAGNRCRIVLHPGLDERDWEAYLRHEVGHCIGIYEHLDDPQAAMHSKGGASHNEITPADRSAAIEARVASLGNRITVAGVSR